MQSLPEVCKSAIAGYFDGFYPDRRAKKKIITSDDDAPYMRYYMPRQSGSADIGRAMRIEKSAWETAMLLEAETEEEPENAAHSAPPSPLCGEAARHTAEFPCAAAGNEYCTVLSALDAPIRQAIAAAVCGEMKNFCKEHSIMPEEASRLINETAFDITGDILIDDDFTILDDYLDDVRYALGIIGITYKEDK